VAFSSTVKLNRTTTHDFLWFGGLIQFNGLSSKSKFLGVKGPGLVYIDMKQSRMFFKKDQLSLYVIVLYALLYFTMFLVILLDRRDPLAGAGAAPGGAGASALAASGLLEVVGGGGA
jgi:hypothetical protein